MKKLLLPAVVAFICTITACEKNSAPPEYDNSLAGTWKEYQSFISPGAGGEWKNINGVTIVLNADSTYVTNNETSAWGKSGRITDVTDSSFSIRSNSTNFISPRNCRYTIKDGVLEVWYFCIEGCGSRFRKDSN